MQTEATNTLSESFNNFYNNFIDQLPGIGIGVLIIILGLLLGAWIGNFAKRRISQQTQDPLMSRFFKLQFLQSCRIHYLHITLGQSV